MPILNPPDFQAKSLLQSEFQRMNLAETFVISHDLLGSLGIEFDWQELILLLFEL